MSLLLVLAVSLTPATAPAQQATAPAVELPPTVDNASDGPGAMERLSLQGAVERALDRNPSVAVAMEEVRRAEGLMHEARAGALPTVTGNGVYTRLDADRVLSGRVIAGVDSLAASVTLAVPLVVPARWAQWSHASENTDLARLSVADARRQVAVATARAALTVIAQKRTEDVFLRALETARAHLDYAHGRVAGGVGNRLDEVRAAQEVATNEAQWQSASLATFRAREALGVLVGGDRPVDVIDPPALPSPAEGTRATDGALIDGRADLRVLAARIDAADHIRRDTWTEYLPFLTGLFQPFYQNPPTLTLPQLGWQAQLLLTVPFWDGGIRQGEAREREALTAEARANLDAALRQARADVRTAWESVRRADAALLAAHSAATLAAEALTLATLAYRAGATTNLEVIDAERQARDAAATATVSEDSSRQARLDLLVAAGHFP